MKGKMERSRRELESYLEDIQDLDTPLQRASDPGAPTAMTILQVKSALDELKERMEAAQMHLTRNETGAAAIQLDKVAKKGLHQAWNETKERAQTLLCIYQASNQVCATNRALRKIEDKKKLYPSRDYSKSISTMESELSDIKTTLNGTTAPYEHPLWVQLDDLDDRMQNILMTEVIPVETKDFPKDLPRSQYKITNLVVPKFSGKIEQWLDFWEEFEHAVHNKKDLDNTTRLVYLKQAILDPGLKQTIADLGVKDKSYEAALKTLHDRFDKPRIIHRKYCEAIKSIPTNTNSRVSLTQLADKVQHILTGLERLDAIDGRQILTSMTEMEMNKELKHEWLTETAKRTSVPPVEEVIAFIRQQADQAEGEEESAPVKPPAEKGRNKPAYNKHKGSTHVAVAAPPPSAPSNRGRQVQQPQPQIQPTRTAFPCRYACPLCSDNHYPYNCSVFVGYTVAQRKEHVNSNNLCNNCLKPGHSASICRSSYRCKTCQGEHNSLLHEGGRPPATQTSQGTVHTATATNSSSVLITTAELLVKGPTGLVAKARALLDGGSSISIISNRLLQTLQLQKTAESMFISGVGKTSTQTAYSISNIHLSAISGSWNQQQRVAVMPKVTSDLPLQAASSVRRLPHIAGKELADSHFDLPGRIVGEDALRDVYLPGESKGPPGTPTAWLTVFGWVLKGCYTPDDSKSIRKAPVCTAISPDIITNHTDDLLTKFWELEEVSRTTPALTPEEEKVEEHYKNTHSFDNTAGRYKVSLPRKEGNFTLGESRTQALNRARANERSLLRKGTWDKFQSVIKEYLHLQHARPVTAMEMTLPAASCYYMPMHGVYKDSSTTTKLRVVFDASAKSTTNISLNDLLAVGPTLHPTLDKILLKFRSYQVALSGDIAKMYREVLLEPEDKQLHRFLWRPTQDQPFGDYLMNRVTFGVAASPYVAVKTLQQTAKDFSGDFPQAAWHLTHSFYVDDLLGGANSEEEALELYRDLRQVLSKGGFNLRKWRSSSNQVLAQIPDELLEELPTQDLVDRHSAKYPKALGVAWNSRKDTMATHIELPTGYSSTKRGVVSDIARTFDVLGWLAPAILPMKLLYKDLWKQKIGWDEEVPDAFKLRHKEWREELPALASI